MLGRAICTLALSLAASASAVAGIELLSFKQDLNPHQATLKLGVRLPDINIETETVLQYPGYCGTRLQNGEEKVMLSNKQASIVAFNFQSGTKSNDCVALALLRDKRLVYYLDLAHVVGQAVKKSQGQVDESFFRVTDVVDDAISLSYYEPYPASRSFTVVAHIATDGTIQIGAKDIKTNPP